MCVTCRYVTYASRFSINKINAYWVAWVSAIGYVISHEIAHAFNTIPDILANNRSKCLIDQYNNYTVTQIDKQVRKTILKKKREKLIFMN